MNFRETNSILKLSLVGLQLGVVVILVLTGIQFKNTKEARDFVEPLRNEPDEWRWGTLFIDLDFRYYSLLVDIVCLTIEVPVMLASLFLNNYILIHVAACFGGGAAGLYIFHAIYFNTRVWLGGAIAGVIITVVSSTVATILAKRIKKGQM